MRVRRLSFSLAFSGVVALSLDHVAAAQIAAQPFGNGFQKLSGQAGAISLADFDQDGNLDLAVIESAPFPLRTLLGDGDGTFAAPIQTPIAENFQSIVTGKLDADTLPDAYVVNAARTEIWFLRGNGDGTFTKVSVLPAFHPGSMVIGDFDGDGLGDVAYLEDAFSTQPGVHVAKLLPNGSLSPVSHHPLPASVCSLLGSDFDHDGDLDLLAECAFPNRLYAIRNAAGVFSVLPGFTSTSECSFSAAGDLNGDGFPDLARPVLNGMERRLGNGAGNFGPALTIPFGVEFTSTERPTILADFNGDSRLDVVIVKQDWVIRCALGNGAGGFLPFADLGKISNVGHVLAATGDVDSDGISDLVLLADVSGLLGVVRGRAVSGLASQPVASRDFAETRVVDLDQDGATDLVGVDAGNGELVALRGNGLGGFVLSGITGTGANPRGVVIDDFDLDGELDAVVGFVGSIAKFHGNGNGTFSVPAYQTITFGGSAGAASGDFNGDGERDFITGYGSNGYSYLLGTAGLGFTQVQVSFTANLVSTPPRCAVGRFDADSLDDAVFSLENGVHVELGDSANDFALEFPFLIQIAQRDVDVANVDGVAGDDLVVTSEIGTYVARWNPPNGFVLPPTLLLPKLDRQGEAAVGDLDSDGDLDIAIHQDTGSSLGGVYINDGTGTFAPSQFFFAEGRDASLADVDGDGGLDLLTNRAGVRLIRNVNDSPCPGSIEPTGGPGCAGSGGFAPYLSAIGCPTAGGIVDLSLTLGYGGSVAYIFLGTQPASVPASPICTLYTFPLLPIAIPLQFSGIGPGLGTYSAQVKLAPNIMPGSVILQAFEPAPANPGGFAASNGLKLTIG